jgi:cell division protein FtsA
MDEPIVVGIDVGTSKICTLVARVENGTNLRILGVGIEPSHGIRKGTVIDLNAASQAISRSIEKAERTSGFEINSALVSLAGSHVSSVNSRGVVGISGRVIDENDIDRALDSAQAVAIPHNREIIHVIQRGFIIDNSEGVKQPIGMHGYRMEVEAHIITASSSTVENLRQCVANSGIEVSQFVLNPLAAGEVALTETEREIGVAVVDLGGGTTNLAIYINGDVWHTNILTIGGNHITADIAHGLRLPIEKAEEVKMQHGNCIQEEIPEDETFSVVTFGAEEAIKVSRKELANIIEARTEEIFMLVMQEIKRSGYDGLLPAGLVLTGGGSLLPGTRKLASKITGLPVRIAKPEKIVGLTDQISTPAYCTSVGLLQWAILMSETNQIKAEGRHPAKEINLNFEGIKSWLKKLLP